METPPSDNDGNLEVIRTLASSEYHKQAKTLSDLVYTKSVYMNGKKLSGVQSVNIDYDIERPTTRVTISMVIKRDSLKIESDKISFEEASYAAGEPAKGN